ncbi:LysR family transcriptional regulator [Sagittula sp. S175]|uniref:LysR family transcriptional regulator n=1 Tax=Sagittula sp. S175 TaxID=3415129 RepID=UPI003C7CAE74
MTRTGSLLSAAEQLDGTHATVRRQVEGLEVQLGVRLFRRSAGGLELSAAGRMLLPQALEAEASLRQGFNAVRGLDGEAAGRIRLPAHFLLAPVLGEFLSLYPDIHIDMNLSYAIDSIKKRETDVSIRHVHDLTGDAVGRKLFPLSIGVFAWRS